MPSSTSPKTMNAPSRPHDAHIAPKIAKHTIIATPASRVSPTNAAQNFQPMSSMFMTGSSCRAGACTVAPTSLGDTCAPASLRPPSDERLDLLVVQRLLQLRLGLLRERGLEHRAAVLAHGLDRLVGRRPVDDHEERRRPRLHQVAHLLLEL